MRIPFGIQTRDEYHRLMDKVLSSNRLSEGSMVDSLEDRFGEWTGLYTSAVSSGGAALLSILEFVGVKEKRVAMPANTFWATAQAVKMAGGIPVYIDCNRTDLCLSYNALRKAFSNGSFGAAIVVHIGGHIAFDIQRIAELCRHHDVPLIEDCAHAAGASWNGKFAGSWGIGGAYSLYATKPLTTGEGGFVVSRDPKVVGFTKKYRNYGKSKTAQGTITYEAGNSFNFRMNELTAALGIVQLARFQKMLAWKRSLAAKFDLVFSNRVQFPCGMVSGYYKYIVFGYAPKITTGKVYSVTDQCDCIDMTGQYLPNSRWIAENHSCLPIYYGWEYGNAPPSELERILL